MQIVYMCYIRIGMPTFTAYNAKLNTDFMFKLNCTYPVCLTRANCTYGNILLQSFIFIIIIINITITIIIIILENICKRYVTEDESKLGSNLLDEMCWTSG